MNAQQMKTKAPDQLPLTRLQASRLASLTGIDQAELVDLSVSEISARFRWQIDPEWLLFRRVCGQVVKTDPATGVQYPVPFATVYAEDTVCSLLGLFPISIPWAWFFPFWCETEVVAETVTDACGNFCIWVPRFEIEWILRFRLERICYLQLFAKPTVGSVLQYLRGTIGPDPAPDALAGAVLKPGTALYQKAEQVLGSETTRKLAAAGSNQTFGSTTTGQNAILARPAFSSPLPPALPKQFRKPTHKSTREEHRSAVRSTLANQLNLNGEILQDLDLRRYQGPFLRCYDILVPEWFPIFEVPDISFRVTQDVTGNGTQEVIYSGELFDVPWGGNSLNVTLVASQIAVSTTTCNTPNIACNNVPSLEYVGLMPLVNPPSPAAAYIDPVAGFATRPNPPHLNGTLAGPSSLPANSPYLGTLQIYGCTQVDSAAYYRLRYTYTAPGSITASPLMPFTGLTWLLYREVGGVLETQYPASDANGWYPVISPADGWFPNSMVLEWATPGFANGLYTVQLEVADGAKTLLATSAPVGFAVDNSAPVPTYSALWSTAADMSGAQTVPTDDCIVIDRGATPVDIYVQVSYSVTASHLRSAWLGSGGCSGGATLSSATSSAPQATPALTVQHWFEDENDNTFWTIATFLIPASYPQGVYSFNMWADTRAFNPAGADDGPLDDWNYNFPDPIFRDPSFAVGVVNVDPA